MVDFVAETVAEDEAEAPYNASDPEQVQKARKKSGRKKIERLDFIRIIMGTPRGREWILGVLNLCKIFGNPVIPGDPYLTYHNIGGQNIGKKLLQDINDSSPDFYVLMMKEAKNEG